MRRSYIIIIAILLTSIVGYLAIDRQEKDDARQHEKSFKQKYIK